jgi:hypothetical protein
VKQHILPLVEIINQYQQRKLGLDVLRPGIWMPNLPIKQTAESF